MFGPVFAQCALTWDAYAGIHLSAEAGQHRFQPSFGRYELWIDVENRRRVD
jgi:hypothetical protein